jgi:hypothetical protein
MFFAGADWADDHHDVAVVDQEASPARPLQPLVGSTPMTILPGPDSEGGRRSLRATKGIGGSSVRRS